MTFYICVSLAFWEITSIVYHQTGINWNIPVLVGWCSVVVYQVLNKNVKPDQMAVSTWCIGTFGALLVDVARVQSGILAAAALKLPPSAVVPILAGSAPDPAALSYGFVLGGGGVWDLIFLMGPIMAAFAAIDWGATAVGRRCHPSERVQLPQKDSARFPN